jgi:hypothetical protein
VFRQDQQQTDSAKKPVIGNGELAPFPFPGPDATEPAHTSGNEQLCCSPITFLLGRQQDLSLPGERIFDPHRE